MDENPRTTQAQQRLLRAMLTGSPLDQIEQQVKNARWIVPSRVTIAIADLEPEHDLADLPSLDTRLLVGIADTRLAVAGPDTTVRAVAAKLYACRAVISIAVSWAARVEEVPLGYKRTRQALEQQDMIGVRGFIECSRPDPPPADIGEDLLAPLGVESAHQRVVLAETLQLWLQTRDSAPALARRLKIHANTARRRLALLKKMFGDVFQDPEQTLPLLSALEVALPRWRDADTSGTKRYRHKK